MKETITYDELLEEQSKLRQQLQEANETIEAIRIGQVDALILENEKGHELFIVKKANQTYKQFIEKMKEGAITISPEGNILYSNSQFASIVNFPLSKIIGMPVIKFIPEEVKEFFKMIIAKGWKSDSKGEILMKNKNNELVPFLLSATSLELDEGPALSIVFTDLSTQKEIQKQLQIKNEELQKARRKAEQMNEELEDIVKERTRDPMISREYFESLADNIPVIVWTANAEGSVDYFNKQWYEQTGLSFEESKDLGGQQVLHHDDFESTAKAWQKAIKEQTNFKLEFRIKRAIDGEYRWHLGKGKPLKDEAGNVIAWFGTCTDIEDQMKQLEQKDEFITIASHELRTPLTSLKGYIQLLESQENLPHNLKMYVSKAHGSVTKLHRLVNDLLDISKIKADKLKFNTDIFDLAHLINKCTESCRNIYPSFTIKKEPGKDIHVRGNAERLEQVLMNLINNAVKYSGESKEVIIRTEKDGRYAIVSVIDFGIGMSAAEQTKIFDRFYRVQDDKQLIQGLGMGLYISSEIIKEHKGRMSVKSKLKEGSVFSFSIPLADSSQ